MNESALSIGFVNGGFVLTTQQPSANVLGEYDERTEVFMSQAKLLKAVRAAVESQSLVAKTKDEDKAE